MTGVETVDRPRRRPRSQPRRPARVERVRGSSLKDRGERADTTVMFARTASRIPWNLLVIEAIVVLLAIGAGWLVTSLA